MRRDVSYVLPLDDHRLPVRVFPVQVHLLDYGEVTIRSLNLESCVQIRPGSTQPLPMSSFFFFSYSLQV